MNYENKYYEFTDNNLNPRILYDIFTILFGVRKIGLIHLPIGKYNFIQKQLIDFNLFEVAIRYLIISEDEGSRENLLRDTDNNDNATHIELWFSREESIEVNPFKNPGKTLSYPDCCVKSYESNLGLSNFKTLESSYGPIRKLHSRQTDILTLQEDKISYVLVGKNLLSDAAAGGAGGTGVACRIR